MFYRKTGLVDDLFFHKKARSDKFLDLYTTVLLLSSLLYLLILSRQTKSIQAYYLLRFSFPKLLRSGLASSTSF